MNQKNALYPTLSLIFMGLLLLLLGLSLVRPLLLLGSHYLVWSNEGWNAGHVARFVAGGLLYPESHELATNNYPPLSFLLMAPLGAAGFDLIFSGRIMALAAWLLTAALLYLCGRRMGAGPLGAGLGSIFFMAVIARFFPYYIAMYEPQWLAHAIMLLGLYLFLGAKNRAETCLAVGVMVLAGLTKHNIIAVPLACFVWLFIYQRARLAAALATAAFAGLASLGALQLAFGKAFWFNLFNARVLSLYHFTRKAEHLLSIVGPLLFWIIASLRDRAFSRNPHAVLVHLLMAASFVEFLAFASGVGVAANVVFDFVLACSLGIALLASHYQPHAAYKPAFAVLCGVLFLQIAAWPNFKYLAIALDADARQELFTRAAKVEKTIAALRAVDGPAWCEQAAICYWAGKPYTYDNFNVEMRLDTGKLTLENMQAEMNRLGIRALQIDNVKTVPGEPATYDESILAPLLLSFSKKILPEGGHGAIWVRE